MAEKYPEKIIKIPIDVFEGITDEQASSRHLPFPTVQFLPLLTDVHVSGSQSILLAMKGWLQEGRLCVQAQQAVDGLKVTGDKTAAKEQIKALYKTFTDSDCTMVEVSSASRIHQGEYAQRDAHMAPVCP